MHDTEGTKCDYSSLTESLYRILNMKQHDKENIMDYSHRSKQASDVLKYHVGPDILEIFIENNEEYRKGKK